MSVRAQMIFSVINYSLCPRLCSVMSSSSSSSSKKSSREAKPAISYKKCTLLHICQKVLFVVLEYLNTCTKTYKFNKFYQASYHNITRVAYKGVGGREGGVGAAPTHKNT